MPSYLEQILLRAFPVFLRVGGVMTFAPFFGNAAVSPRIKAILALVVTALLYPVLPHPGIGAAPWDWVQIALSEAMLGLGIGLCLQFIFEGAQLAGQIAGFQFAFSLVNVIDPTTNVDTPVLSIFHQLIALLLFLQMNIHHWILRGLAKSFAYVPVGTVTISAPALRGFFHAAGAMWLVGLQLAAPILLATFVLDLSVGFLSKASPQMSAIFLSIPVKSLVGYAVLSVAIGLWPGFLEKQFILALAWSERLLHLAH